MYSLQCVFLFPQCIHYNRLHGHQEWEFYEGSCSWDLDGRFCHSVDGKKHIVYIFKEKKIEEKEYVSWFQGKKERREKTQFLEVFEYFNPDK